jgi:tetratricopeptide (TPR) repeat protein
MIEPNCADALNNLAWVKATNEDARFRNPDEALSLALRACSLTDYNQPDFLDTLAAAYAAVGKFQDAVETAQKAVNIAQAAGKEELTRKIKEHLDLYLTGRPYSENHPYP